MGDARKPKSRLLASVSLVSLTIGGNGRAAAGGALLLLCSSLGSTALAGPDACTTTGADTYSCSGDQSDGIDVGTSGSPPDDAVFIEIDDLMPRSNGQPYTGPFLWSVDNPNKGDLTFDVFPGIIVLAPAPSSANSAIEFANTGKDSGNSAAAMTLRFTGTIDNSSEQAAISSSATGHDGTSHKGNSDFDTGKRGGNGGTGGSISVRLSEPHDNLSATSIGSTESGALNVLSQGGDGGKGEDASFTQSGAGGTGGNAGRAGTGATVEQCRLLPKRPRCRCKRSAVMAVKVVQENGAAAAAPAASEAASFSISKAAAIRRPDPGTCPFRAKISSASICCRRAATALTPAIPIPMRVHRRVPAAPAARSPPMRA